MGKIKNLLGNFQPVPRSLIFDNELSDRARFVYCYMASKPEGWDFILGAMANDLGYTVETLRKYINQLVDAGWLTKGEQANEGKYGSVEYTINPCRKKPSTEKSVSEKSIHNIIENNKRKEIKDKETKKEKKNEYDIIVDAWNKTANKCGLQTIQGIKGKRKDKLDNLFAKCDSSSEELIKVIESLPYADNWVLGKGTKEWFITFDWLIANTNNWYVRALEGGMHTKNAHGFNSIFNENKSEYHPHIDGRNMIWNESLSIYIAMYDLDMLVDGYTNDNRPASARVRRNSINYKWNTETKKWEAE